MTDASVPTLLVSELVREDPEMRDIVEDFVGDLQTRIHELRDAFAATDWDRMATLAHQLKGAGGSYGYPAISQRGAAMEADFKNRRHDTVELHLKALADLASAAGAGLK